MPSKLHEWEESSSNFGTPVCDVASCGTGTGTGPHNGSFWVWFGGIDAAETGFMRQDVTLAVGTAELSFWLEVPSSSLLAADFMSVSIDGIDNFVAETAAGFFGNHLDHHRHAG